MNARSRLSTHFSLYTCHYSNPSWSVKFLISSLILLLEVCQILLLPLHFLYTRNKIFKMTSIQTKQVHWTIVKQFSSFSLLTKKLILHKRSCQTNKIKQYMKQDTNLQLLSINTKLKQI